MLPAIAERVVAGGERLLVVSAISAQLAALDRVLWTYTPDSFLPHAVMTGESDALQPVLLAADVTNGNGARHIALADGRWRDAALAFERVFHLFDDAALADARAAWRGLGAQGDVDRRYWKQKDTGGWEQAA